MRRDNSTVPLPDPLKEELQGNFKSRYKFSNGISWELVWQDWCRLLDTQPPTPPTVRALLFSDKNTCEFRIADGLCQLLLKRSYDDCIQSFEAQNTEEIYLFDNFGTSKPQKIEKQEEVNDQPLRTTSSSIMWEIRLEANEDLADAIFALLKEYSEDASLTLRRIQRGSLILVLEGSPEGFSRIEDLFTNGQLSQLLGVPVSRLGVTPDSERINLSDWFQGLFEAGWCTAKELMTPQQLTPAFWSEGIKRAKLIQFEEAGKDRSVLLMVSLKSQGQQQTNIQLRVYPSGQEIYLPEALQLCILSEGQIFEAVIATSADEFIQCEFDGSIGDRFSVELKLNDKSFIESFIV